MGAYYRPTDVETALGLLAETGAVPLAGGTDLYPADAAAAAWGRPGLDRTDILDLSALGALTRIEDRGDVVEIGALVTWADVAGCALPPWFDSVRAAAGAVGGVQIQNRATLAGNLCNASPAADGVPPLLVLDARVRLARLGQVRELPLAGFLQGNRQTVRAADELLTHIVLPKPAAGARSVFHKLGARRYLVISIAMVAVLTALDAAGRLRDVRIAVGACSAFARRLAALERRLVGLTPAAAVAAVTPADLDGLAPIDDVRATAAYRRHAALVLVRRALAIPPSADLAA